MALTMKQFGYIAVLLLGVACRRTATDSDPRTCVQQGWSCYRLGEYNQALAHFDQALHSPLRLQALYGKAITWDLRQPVATQNDPLAESLYRQIIREAPDDDLAAWSSLALARMKHLVPVGQDPDYAKVRAAYQEVIDRYPRHLAGQEALIYQQSTLIQSLDTNATRQAIGRLLAFVKEQPDSKFISAAYNLLAQGYETLGDADLQLDARIKEIETLEVDASSPTDNAGRYWQVATTAEFLAGRFDVARTYCWKLIEEYPLDFRKFGAKQALARMDEMERKLQ